MSRSTVVCVTVFPITVGPHFVGSKDDALCGYYGPRSEILAILRNAPQSARMGASRKKLLLDTSIPFHKHYLSPWFIQHDTGMKKFLCTWFGDVCYSCSLTVLPGSAWVVLIYVLQRNFFTSVHSVFPCACFGNLRNLIIVDVIPVGSHSESVQLLEHQVDCVSAWLPISSRGGNQMIMTEATDGQTDGRTDGRTARRWL